MSQYILKFFNKLYIKRLRTVVKNKIRRVWKRGFLTSNYLSLVEYEYHSLPLLQQWIIYLHILKLLHDTVFYKKWFLRFQTIFGSEIKVDFIQNRVKMLDSSIVFPTFHPYIECFLNKDHIFGDINQCYPIKIGRAITICLQNEEKCIWNLLQKIRQKGECQDYSFGGTFLSFVEKWQSNTFNLLLQCLDDSFLKELIPHIYSSGTNLDLVQTPNDILRAQLQLVPIDNDIKQKWIHNLNTLSNNSGDTFYKYKEYYEAIITIPFRVYHSVHVPNTLFDSSVFTIRRYLNTPEFNEILSPYWNEWDTMGFIGKIELWRKILGGIRCCLHRRIQNYSKVTIRKLSKEYGRDIWSCDPLILLDPEQKELLDLIENSAKKIRQWIKEYIEQSKQKMDQVIYGMSQPKQFVLNQVINWLNQSGKGIVLGLNGPPGVGKTTFVRNAVAPCFRNEYGESRPVITIGLGGKLSGSSLKGHGFTYVGSKCGQIVQALIQCKCMNPIFYFDELDKVSETPQGSEINSILMQITDFSQNNEFEDSYFSDIKFDLSKCIFIFSYNDSSKIDPILMNRIQEITLKPIPFQEKIHIIKEYTIPKLLKNYKIPSNLSKNYSDSIISDIVLKYTNEPGVRSAEQIMNYIISKQCLLYSQSGLDSIESIQNQLTSDSLSTFISHLEEMEVRLPFNVPQIGYINGLYATNYGIGGLLPLESNIIINDKEQDKISGNVSNVMKESQVIAKIVGSKHTTDLKLHIHCNQAGLPKDGPSAGLALALIYWSHANKTKLPHTMAVTGEITMRGQIDMVGGIIQKFFAAIHYGIKHILAPKGNQQDWENYIKNIDEPLQKHMKSLITVHWVSSFDEAVKLVRTLAKKR